MNIRINGEEVALSNETMNLYELVTGKGLVPERVVIEVNLEIVPRERWPFVSVREDDQIEIVSFVGGG
jgi:sulfur carrier protein